MRRGLKVGLAAALSLAIGGQAYATPTFFFSTESESPGISSPVLELEPGQSQTLYLWIALGDSNVGQLGGISLSLVGDDGLAALSSDVKNPEYHEFVDEAGELKKRWNDPVGSGSLNTDGFLVQNMTVIGAVAAPGESTVRGLRHADVNPALGFQEADPLSDPELPGFLHAEIEIEVSADAAIGSMLEMFLEVGTGRINTDGEFILVNFGDANVGVDGGVVGSRGSIADATVNVIPEPGSLALLGIGGLMLLRRRRA